MASLLDGNVVLDDEDENEFILTDPVSMQPLHNVTRGYPKGQPVYLFCKNGHSFNHDTVENLLKTPQRKFESRRLIEYLRCPVCNDEFAMKPMEDFVRNRGLEDQIESLQKLEEKFQAEREQSAFKLWLACKQPSKQPRNISGKRKRMEKKSKVEYFAQYDMDKTLRGHSCNVRALVVHKDTIISVSKDKTIKLWSLKGVCLKTFKAHSDWIHAVAVHNDTIISGSQDKTIKLWTFEGELVNTLKGHTDGVYALLAHKNRIISGSSDKTIKLWTFEGELVNTLKGHSGTIYTLVIHMG